jgi:hypothetical protein
MNSAAALMSLERDTIRQYSPSTPDWALLILAVTSIMNVACAVALLKWKKWGFFGFIATSVITFVVNLMTGLNIVHALGGLVGIAVLYGVLQIGKEKKGWTQLE